MGKFSRLIRFVAKDGRTLYGDAILPEGVTDVGKCKRARVIEGRPWGNYTITNKEVDVKQISTPLAREDIGTVRGLGLNYAKHAEESGMPIPQYPVLFYKPKTAVTGPFDSIPVAAIAQEAEGLDYECELVVVIGKPCRDVSEFEALKYVGGYSVGNDVSHREWQLKRGGGQWALGKGFDGWAPFGITHHTWKIGISKSLANIILGPGIISSEVIRDPQKLHISTKLNGKTVQNSTTADMIFSTAKLISFLSQGTTLLPGDILFTGTPQGVGAGRNPPLWLRDGDEVEVQLEGVGSCINKVEFEKLKSSKL